MLVRHDAVKELNTKPTGTVRRYWPGKAPDWVRDQPAAPADEEEEDEQQEAERTVVAPPVILKRAEDPRLRRLAQTRLEPEDREQAVARRRQIAAAQVVSRRRRDESGESASEEASDEDESELEGDDDGAAREEEEDEEAIEARRALVRAKLQRRQQQEETLLGDEEEEEEEDESEYETDTDDEEYGRQMLKPVFVPKKERETIAEREALERAEALLYEKEKQRLQERKRETGQLVDEKLRADEAAARAAREGPKEHGDIDTDDDKDEEAEYELWKARELARIRRAREEAEREAAEEAERQRLKNMTEEERKQWEREHPKVLDKGPKKQWKFMQKYWHQGAFYQTAGDNADGAGGDEIYRRDYSAPTGEDKLDRTVLPKVMQVKNFGRRGRVKHTHLVAEDTTVFDNPIGPDETIQRKFEKKMAGTEEVFDKPKRFRT